jgi:CspA family cold shock protein
MPLCDITWYWGKEQLMANGTVKTVLYEKGFGFITPDGGDGGRASELFFHHSAIEEGRLEEYQPGDRVSFDVEPDARNPSRSRATQVRRVSEEAQPEE